MGLHSSQHAEHGGAMLYSVRVGCPIQRLQASTTQTLTVESGAVSGQLFPLQ